MAGRGGSVGTGGSGAKGGSGATGGDTGTTSSGGTAGNSGTGGDAGASGAGQANSQELCPGHDSFITVSGDLPGFGKDVTLRIGCPDMPISPYPTAASYSQGRASYNKATHRARPSAAGQAATSLRATPMAPGAWISCRTTAATRAAR